MFCAVARKASPAAALHYAPGARAAALLPGWFGDWNRHGRRIGVRRGGRPARRTPPPPAYGTAEAAVRRDAPRACVC
ncbi:hypothetical protein ACQ4WX_24845 [Streptomyces lasalocidi]